AAVPAEPFLGGHTMIISGHFHRRVVVYPIGPAGAGKLLTNWLVQMTGADDMPGRGDWDKKGPAAKIFSATAHWRVALARRAWPGRTYGRHLRVSTRRPRPGGELDIWARHPHRRRRPSDAANRLAGRLPGGHRRACAHPGADDDPGSSAGAASLRCGPT